MAPMTFSYTGIRVRDMEESLAFYRDVLGMRVQFRMRLRTTGGGVRALRRPPGRRRVRREEDPRVDGPVPVPRLEGEDGVQVDLLDPLDLEDELGEPLDGLREGGAVARRLPP